MSEEDLRAMNSKESAILTSNLSAETLISEQEVITDILQLRTLANLCESLVSDAFLSCSYDIQTAHSGGPSGLEPWTGDRVVMAGFESRCCNFASELWQFRSPRFASVFRRRH